jgi:hypothetical protein
LHGFDRSNTGRHPAPARVPDRGISDDRRMIQGLAIGILSAGLLLGAWTGIQAWRRRPTTEAQMVGAIVLEAALLTQTVIALVRLAGGEQLDESVTFVAYSVGILLPLPLGFYLARIERTRWGSLSLCFTAVVVAVMTLRLMQLWQVGRG